MSKQSLANLVAIYRRKNGLSAYLEYFRMLGSLEQAIRYACHGKDGKIHDHQYRLGRVKLEQARKVLQNHAEEIDACGSFDGLHTLVEDRTRSIDGFGALAVYDTSLRLGAYLNLWPKVVYLHAGTKKGCKTLGVATNGGTVEMAILPQPIRALEPYQAEDFLCIFKGHFDGMGGKVKGCEVTGFPDRRGRHG